VPKETHHRSASFSVLWTLASRTWREVVAGVLLGAVLGLAFPTFIQLAGAIERSKLFSGSGHYGASVIWPKRGTATLLAILLVTGIYGVSRLYPFAKKFWISWRAGLVSGVSTLWFSASALAFTLLGLTGSWLSLCALILGAAGSALILYRDFKVAENPGAPVDADPDEPILNEEGDILDRQSVVASIIRTAVNDRSAVVAVTGSYGDGKTSVLNLLSAKLEGRTDVVCVRFSTWLPTDQRTLVSTLISAILAKIETRLFIPRIKRDLTVLTRLLFAVLPKVPNPFKPLIEEPSQEQQIAELRRHLSSLPLRVLVVLDDLDRMRKRELNLLLKMLRGVPEFPQLTYICAFDHSALVRTLRKSDTVASQQEAEYFLEKFFPDEIPLPKIERARLSVEFERRFYAICDRCDLVSDPSERQSFKEELRVLWQLTLKVYFNNLRRIKLLTNRLRYSLPVVGQEVNLRDFVLLEAVRLMAPVLYEEIFRNARFFMFPQWRTTDWLEEINPDEAKAQEIRQAYFDRLFADLPRPPAGPVLAVLEDLFPTVKSYLTGASVPKSVIQNSSRAERERRIYHPDFFPRYFIYGVPADQFGEGELSAFVRAMNGEGDVARCVVAAKRKYVDLRDVPMKRWDFLHRVAFSIGRFNSVSLQALAIAISELSDRMGNPDVPGLDDALTGIRIVFAVANESRLGVSAQHVLEEVVGHATSDMFATRILNEATSDNGIRFLEDVSVIDRDKLQSVFRSRMSARYRPGGEVSFFPAEGKTAIAPLGRWALCGSEGKEQVHAYLTHEFGSAHWKLGRFLSYFTPLQGISPGQDPLVALAIYFPLEELQKLITEYGDSSGASVEDFLAVAQFKSLYAGYAGNRS